MANPNRTPDTSADEPSQPIQTEPDQPSRGLARVFRLGSRRANQTSEPEASGEPTPAEPDRPAEPVRSTVKPSHESRNANHVTPDTSTSSAPDPHRRGFAYWIEELFGIVPMAAPLAIEAIVHYRFGQHVIGLDGLVALLFPLSIGLGAIRVAFYLDRARLRKDPTGLIRAGLYGYLVAGFWLSNYYISTYNQETGAKLGERADVDNAPAIVVGCAQAAGVLLWELRARQRRREVDRAQHSLDEDRVRRGFMLPVWSYRMVRWSVMTGVRDWSVIVEAFAPLVLAQKAGQPHAKWPDLAEPAAEPIQTSEPASRTTPSRRRKPAPSQTSTPTEPAAEPSRARLISVDDDALLVQLVAAYPDRTKPPTRRAVETACAVGSTVAGRLRKHYAAAADDVARFDQLVERAREVEQQQRAQ